MKTYSKDVEVYPLQLIVKEVTNKDQRYLTRPPLPIDQEFLLILKLYSWEIWLMDHQQRLLDIMKIKLNWGENF